MIEVLESDGCPFSLQNSEDEREALDWLFRTLESVHKAGGRNAVKARLAAQLIKRTVLHARHLHLELHRHVDVESMFAPIESSN